MTLTNQDLHNAFKDLLCTASACFTGDNFPSRGHAAMDLPKKPLQYGEVSALRKFLDAESGNFEGNCALLPIVPRESSGLLGAYATWDFTEDRTAWARVEFVLERREGKRFCYRFEMPDPGGGHAYPHAQNSQEFARQGGSKPLLTATGDPVNTSYPAFPLYVKNPVELLVTAFIALYDNQMDDSLIDAINKPKNSMCLQLCIRRIISNLRG